MKPAEPDVPTAPPSEAETYRWMHANRGNFVIAETLARSDRDADFDARIESAIRAARAGRHRYSPLRSLPG